MRIKLSKPFVIIFSATCLLLGLLLVAFYRSRTTSPDQFYPPADKRGWNHLNEKYRKNPRLPPSPPSEWELPDWDKNVQLR